MSEDPDAKAGHGERWASVGSFRVVEDEHGVRVMDAEQETKPEYDVERLCVVMHDAYEAAAVEAGWATQPRSRVPWSLVPEPNRVTMRAAVRALLDAVTGGHPHAGMFCTGSQWGILSEDGAVYSVGTWSGGVYVPGCRCDAARELALLGEPAARVVRVMDSRG